MAVGGYDDTHFFAASLARSSGYSLVGLVGHASIGGRDNRPDIGFYPRALTLPMLLSSHSNSGAVDQTLGNSFIRTMIGPGIFFLSERSRSSDENRQA